MTRPRAPSFSFLLTVSLRSACVSCLCGGHILFDSIIIDPSLTCLFSLSLCIHSLIHLIFVLISRDWTRMNRTLVTLMLIAFARRVVEAASSSSSSSSSSEWTIDSLSSLNAWLESGEEGGGEIGFLSEGNYHTVSNELSSRATPRYYASKSELYEAVRGGEVKAGLVSGTVENENNEFTVFASEQVSIRAMLVNPDGTYANGILSALDAAIVRVIESGGIEQSARDNEPYDALVVHSCQSDPAKYDWPNRSALPPGDTLRIASLGPYDWGGSDGNYLVDPPVGFWPDVYDLIEAEFVQAYNITFERVWNFTSRGVMDDVMDGSADTTEPYMMVGAAYDDDISRKSAFDLSCITSATQDKYFVNAIVASESSSSNAARNTWIAVAAVIAALLLLVTCGLAYVYKKEKEGEPLFMDKLLGDADGHRSSAMVTMAPNSDVRVPVKK